MSFLRPPVRQFLVRWGETGFALFGMAFGLWVASYGGWVMVVLGALILFLTGEWAWMAWRRARFAQPLASPGLVELDEGAIRYLAPRGGVMGGTVALRDLTMIRLITVSGGRLWQLKQTDGQMLLIPVDAKGADTLFDGFAVLPGIDMGRLVAALETRSGPGLQVLWRRP